MRNRRADITIIRVVSMLMIVLCHTIKYYPFIPGSQIMNQFLNVGVEIFFAISGFLYARKNITSYKNWMLSRIRRIHIPVLIVVTVNIAVLMTLFHTTPGVATGLAYIMNLQGLLFINWTWFSLFIKEIPNLGPLWFTTIIMMCYALVPAFQKVSDAIKKEQKVKVYILILLPLYLFTFILELTTGTTLFYILVFWTGYILADLEYDKERFSAKKIALSLVFIVAMLVLRVVLKVVLDVSPLYRSLVSIEHTILGISIMLFFLECGKRFSDLYEKIGQCKVVLFLDDMSFYIYLVHGIFCMEPTNVYTHMPVLPATVVFVAATLLCAGLLNIFIKRSNHENIYRLR